MKKIIVFLILFVFALIFHFNKVNKCEKKTAKEIFNLLRLAEINVEPDIKDKETEIMYYSPVKYAQRRAIMDCEQIIYEKYRLSD